MIIVSNSSPLIALLAIDKLDILERLFETILIPQAVHNEVFGFPAGRTISCPDFIIPALLPSDTASRFLAMSLHQGESEAIALAIDRGADGIILDDKQARETAARLGLRVIGTLGILMLAKEKGYIDEVRILMDQLMNGSISALLQAFSIEHWQQ